VQAVRVLAGVLGAVLAVATALSIVRTLVIPRSRPGGVSRLVDRTVDKAFVGVARRRRSYEERDRLLSGQAAGFLVGLLVTWLGAFLLAFALMLWPWTGSLGRAARQSVSSLFTLGFDSSRGGGPTALDGLAAACGLIVVAVLIAYLPTLYAAFNRRETEVTLLDARAGSPPWGPELLARTRYGMQTRTDDLPGFYAVWERWAADVAESHSTFPVLVRFRSPQPLTSWLVALLAVMDSAAMYLALCPSRERYEVRMCLRMGFTALRQIAVAVGVPVEDPDPDEPLVLTYEQFLGGVARLTEVGFPVERTAAEAWPHFCGWRVNYEAIAYRLARATDAVPAMWSGSRRWESEPMAPRRPAARAPRRPDGAAAS
jgi:hypothetical protein